MIKLISTVVGNVTTFTIEDQKEPDGYHLGQPVWWRQARLMPQFAVIAGRRRYVGKRWVEISNPPEGKTWLEDNGLKPESSADYYIDTLRRERLFKSDPRALSKTDFRNAIQRRNVPPGYVYQCSPHISEVPLAPSTNRPFNHKEFAWTWKRSARQQTIEAESIRTKEKING